MTNHRAKLIAFYLPQYHPIPENDIWWGKGFTEWRIVTKARPLFPGHYQPRLPAELGFYDLRLREIRQAQAELAREHGIFGFCYYHYWFHGKGLLHRPFAEVLNTGEPDFPFCICWANENWTRTWDGQDKRILIRQTYSVEDDKKHIRWLCKAFEDKRYIRIDKKPLFLVYRVSQIPDPIATTNIWREEAQKVGIGEIYLATVESLKEDRIDPTRVGFDAAVEFQPDWLNLGAPRRRLAGKNTIYDYATIIARMLGKSRKAYKLFKCVTPGWDNSSRRQKNAYILHNSSPELYLKWLQGVLDSLPQSGHERIVFINAWNEWGEGAHLEPCQKWGRAYLEATKTALDNTRLSADTSTA